MTLRVSQLWHYIETCGFYEDIKNIKDFDDYVTDDDDDNDSDDDDNKNNNNNNNKYKNNNDKFGYFGGNFM